MKKTVSLLLALLLALCLAPGALADEYDIYITLTEQYANAFLRENEFDLEYAIGVMRSLAALYDSNNVNGALANYQDAQMYYKYAQGVVAFEEERYLDVVSWMTDCSLAALGGYEPATYLAFAQGMLQKERGEYLEAIKLLSGVSGLADYTGRRLGAIAECRQKYKKSVLPSAQEAYNNKDYDGAEELCNSILAVLPNDEETLELRKKAREGSGKDPALQEYQITITPARARSAESVQLKWEGEPETYTVSWTPDLVKGTGARSEVVTGHEFTVTGLLPNTTYRFRVEYQGSSAQADEKTRQAEDCLLPDGKKMWTGSCTVYTYRDVREDYLDEEVPVYQYKAEHRLKAQGDKNIGITDENLDRHFMLYVFTTFGLPQDVQNKTYTLLLHVDGFETLASTGTVGDETVCCNTDATAQDSSLYVVLYRQLDALAEKYDKLTGTAYTLDLLLDGSLVGTVTGQME